MVGFKGKNEEGLFAKVAHLKIMERTRTSKRHLKNHRG